MKSLCNTPLSVTLHQYSLADVLLAHAEVSNLHQQNNQKLWVAVLVIVLFVVTSLCNVQELLYVKKCQLFRTNVCLFVSLVGQLLVQVLSYVQSLIQALKTYHELHQ
jgi:hypothetical protein